jgi:pimeloyl-ACP methyl ester carboxylesterase
MLGEAGVQQVKLSQGSLQYRESGSGPPIVFMHGLLVNGTLWRDVVPQLEDRFRCVVPELPLGSHRVPLDPSADLSPPGLASIVDEFMAALDLNDVTLVGNDTGGAISQLVAANHPQRLARLVLTPCDMYDYFLPPMFRPMQWIARVPGAIAALLQPTRISALHNTPLAFGLLTKRKIPREQTRDWLEPALSDREVRRDVVKVLRGIDTRYTQEAAERLKSFDKPALVAWADGDRVFKREYGERFAADVPDGRFELVSDSGTFMPLDQPGPLAKLIGDFAGGPSKAAGSRQRAASS